MRSLNVVGLIPCCFELGKKFLKGILILATLRHPREALIDLRIGHDDLLFFGSLQHQSLVDKLFDCVLAQGAAGAVHHLLLDLSDEFLLQLLRFLFRLGALLRDIGAEGFLGFVRLQPGAHLVAESGRHREKALALRNVI